MATVYSRSPHGERGLKLLHPSVSPLPPWSLSSWRAWIEIRRPILKPNTIRSRSPHGERGLKYQRVQEGWRGAVSLSSWRAWIEIQSLCLRRVPPTVALLMESVD